MGCPPRRTEIKPIEPAGLCRRGIEEIFILPLAEAPFAGINLKAFVMKKLVSIFSCILIAKFSFAQFEVSGVVINQLDNTPIENAVIYFSASNIYTLSDSMGYFHATVNQQQIPSATHIAFQHVSNGVQTGVEDIYQHIFIYMLPKNNLFEPVVITDTRADYTAPITYTNINGEDLNKNNFGEDMPMLLEFTPSAVVTSDAGNGIGYTGIRIRGSDATRINVTINGVPYNDAESEQTYWVDLPDIAASVDDIQIQRGVGTSSNGISSLGGAININTNNLSSKPYASASFAAGSFNLLKANAAFGTGALNNKWIVEGRVSKIKSNGYIDRSFADLNSFFLTGAYRGNTYSSIVNIFSGEEHTYQSWGGVPKDSLVTNRTFNPYTYENQTDNYTQTHYQWHQYFYFKKDGLLNFTMNYTKGLGYYEQLESDQYFSDYGVAPVVAGTDTIFSSDFITQKWLDNAYYGAYLNYENVFAGKKLSFKTGAAFYLYAGDHFGKIIWSEFATTLGNNFEWYRNDALKNDANMYAQFSCKLSDKFTGWLDLQMRNVNYTFNGYEYGTDDEIIQVDQKVNILFFNPKIGISYAPVANQLLYLSVAKSGKEPNRDDYVESSELSRPLPEILYDMEAGHKVNVHGWQMHTNVYYMHYINQLVLNGEVNDVGAYTRINVPESFRAGIECAWAKTFFSKLIWNANFTISRNRIKEYTEFIDNWDTGDQIAETYKNSALAFSPALIAADQIEFILFHRLQDATHNYHNLSVSFQTKYVGRQYIDNTSTKERSLDPYLINDLAVNFNISQKFIRDLGMKFIVQNIFGYNYESNAWVYRYVYEGAEQELNGYFPQAGRNFVLSLSLNF